MWSIFIVTIDLNSLRNQNKIKLQKLSAGVRSILSEHIANKIIQHPLFIQSQNIGCYIPIVNEVDTWRIINNIWEQNKHCYLPAFLPQTKNQLCFVRYFPYDQLTKAKHETLEPKIIPANTILPQKLDLVIVPLVGFNDNNFRLGHGAGCYDRTFAFKKQGKISQKPYLFGLGFKCQHRKFEPNSWDVAMDEIISA